MELNLTTIESQYLVNILLSPDLYTPQYQPELRHVIANKLLYTSPIIITPQEVGFLQYMLQEQSEIWGRQSSTANEKLPVTMASWVPQTTRKLIKSVSDKLGAKLSVDTTQPSIPNSPRREGSISIMKDPTLK